MADAKLTALTAASALAAADLFYVSQSAASRKATGTQLLALVGTAYVPLAGGTMTGALTIASGTLTASAPALNISQTWNGSGVSFRAIDVNITNTLSANSFPFVLSVGGSPIFYVNQIGDTTVGNYRTISDNGSYGWSSSGALFLYRDAAATLAQRNGTNAQTLRVYGTYTDSSNYERLSLSTTAGTSVNITAETLGTGGDNLDIVLTPAGTGSVSLIGSVNKVANNSAIRTGNTDGTGNLYLDVSKLVLRRGNAGTFTSLIFTGATSGNVALVPGGAALSVRLGDDSGYGTLNSGINSVYEYQQYAEVTAPSAPSVNVVRVYAEDNGAGKTRLMALFATGAAQQIAIEP